MSDRIRLDEREERERAFQNEYRKIIILVWVYFVTVILAIAGFFGVIIWAVRRVTE